MLPAVPTRLIVRRSRSSSPSTHAFQTGVNAATCRGVRETQVTTHRSTVLPTCRVSKCGLLDDETAGVNADYLVQHRHLAASWLSNLVNQRSSWGALTSRGHKGQYWEESRGTRPAELPSVGLLSAAAIAFCLKKDSENKGR